MVAHLAGDYGHGGEVTAFEYGSEPGQQLDHELPLRYIRIFAARTRPVETVVNSPGRA